MIRVTVELISNRTKKRLDTLEIVNDETGTAEIGNYYVECGKIHARVEGFKRLEHNALDLVLEALVAIKNADR